MTYRFGPYTLNVATRQLLRNRTERHLSPKAYDLLVLLVSNRRRAMPKAELQQRLWPSTFVEETNLATLVAEIRRVLEDDARVPRFVRTVYGFGYRFVGDVAETAVGRGGSRMKPFVVVDGRRVALTERDTVIGRGQDATISIDSAGVSRHHARIVVTDQEAVLEDLGSKNGTYVGAQRVTGPRVLADGDEIRVGPVTVTFRAAPLARSTATVI